MRNPRRTAGPILRTTPGSTPVPATPSKNLLLRTPDSPAPSMPVRRSRAVPMTGAQRDSTGRRSDWSKPAELRPFTTPMMPAWSYTKSDAPRGGVWISELTSRNQ